MIRALILLVCGTLPAVAQPATTRRAQQEAREYLTTCHSADPEILAACKHSQSEFVWDYVSAKSGDYDDQKNVAFLLEKGDEFGAIIPNRLQACAWWLIVTNGSHARSDRLDRVRAGEVCGGLDPAEQQMVAMRATVLSTELRTAPARKLPEPQISTKPCKGPLDGTAYPLGVTPPPPLPGRCS